MESAGRRPGRQRDIGTWKLWMNNHPRDQRIQTCLYLCEGRGSQEACREKKLEGRPGLRPCSPSASMSTCACSMLGSFPIHPFASPVSRSWTKTPMKPVAGWWAGDVLKMTPVSTRTIGVHMNLPGDKGSLGRIGWIGDYGYEVGRGI
jgi:hypothetical protein